MRRREEIAKFVCGFEAFHSLMHAYMWFTNATPTVFGITATPTWNGFGVIVNGAIAILLGLYGWGAWRGGQKSQRTR